MCLEKEGGRRIYIQWILAAVQMPWVSWPGIKERHEYKDSTLWRQRGAQDLLSSRPLSLHLWHLNDSFLIQSPFQGPLWLLGCGSIVLPTVHQGQSSQGVKHPLVDRQIPKFPLVHWIQKATTLFSAELNDTAFLSLIISSVLRCICIVSGSFSMEYSKYLDNTLLKRNNVFISSILRKTLTEWFHFCIYRSPNSTFSISITKFQYLELNLGWLIGYECSLFPNWKPVYLAAHKSLEFFFSVS